MAMHIHPDKVQGIHHSFTDLQRLTQIATLVFNQPINLTLCTPSYLDEGEAKNAKNVAEEAQVVVEWEP